MTEYGIWSAQSGGFIETQLWSEQEARDRITELGDEAPEDAEVLAICPDHEEQAALYCEICNETEEV